MGVKKCILVVYIVKRTSATLYVDRSSRVLYIQEKMNKRDNSWISGGRYYTRGIDNSGPILYILESSIYRSFPISDWWWLWYTYRSLTDGADCLNRLNWLTSRSSLGRCYTWLLSLDVARHPSASIYIFRSSSLSFCKSCAETHRTRYFIYPQYTPHTAFAIKLASQECGCSHSHEYERACVRTFEPRAPRTRIFALLPLLREAIYIYICTPFFRQGRLLDIILRRRLYIPICPPFCLMMLLSHTAYSGRFRRVRGRDVEDEMSRVCENNRVGRITSFFLRISLDQSRFEEWNKLQGFIDTI